MDLEPVLWRRLDTPGHEAARLLQRETGWRLDGTAVFVHDGDPVRLDYQIELDAAWQTVSVDVSGWIGKQVVASKIMVGASQLWTLNGLVIPEVSGCRDIDLNFSPANNLIPIRRSHQQISQAADIRAAWLRFPQFTLEPLDQVYRRVGPEAYHYESAGGAFTADLAVNPSGWVIHYPGLWTSS